MSNRNLLTIFTITFFALVIPSVSLAIVDNAYTRESLKGLTALFVTVNIRTNQPQVFENVGITEDRIQTDAELKLRMVGIKVVSNREEVYKIPGTPTLAIDVLAYHSAGELSFAITIDLLQRTHLDRNSAIHSLSSTWGNRMIGKTGTSYTDMNLVRDNAKERIDAFINAYLSVNPKGSN